MKEQKYTVLVDDNYRFMDEDERYEVGSFSTLEEAVAACKAIVDEFLHGAYKPGMTAEQLYDGYVGFGEDPFISGPSSGGYSSWDYAKQRCEEIARSGQP
jgi:hypothetical protein